MESGQFMPHLPGPQNLLTRGWVGPRASLGALEKKTSLASFRNQTTICQLPIQRHGADEKLQQQDDNQFSSEERDSLLEKCKMFFLQ